MINLLILYSPVLPGEVEDTTLFRQDHSQDNIACLPITMNIVMTIIEYFTGLRPQRRTRNMQQSRSQSEQLMQASSIEFLVAFGVLQVHWTGLRSHISAHFQPSCSLHWQHQLNDYAYDVQT